VTIELERVVMADEFGAKHGVWCCEKKEKCGWQGFLLTAGLAWGEIPENTMWRHQHDAVCGGRLIQIVARHRRVDRAARTRNNEADPGSIGDPAR
jgi:hypothetical protein